MRRVVFRPDLERTPSPSAEAALAVDLPLRFGLVSRQLVLMVDSSTVKGLDKLTYVRLAEVLSQKQVVSNDAITDALYTQDQYGDPFVDLLVAQGAITEWDLAKVVVEHFQIPFLMAGGHEVSEEAKSVIPEIELFKANLMPLDRFGDVLTVSMPILTPGPTLERIRKQHGVTVFPFVGMITENRKLLGDNFEGFKSWQAQAQKERETRKPKKGSGGGPDDWTNIFDSGDAAVLDGLD